MAVLSLNGTFTYPIELLKTLTVDETSTFKKAVMIGRATASEGVYGVAIGNQDTEVSTNGGVAIGKGSKSKAEYGIAIGEYNEANAESSIAAGTSSRATDKYSFTWSGVDNNDIKFESSGIGTFSINPSSSNSSKPENGFYIGKKTFPTLVGEYAISSVTSNANTFSKANIFNEGISVKKSLTVESGSFTANAGSVVTLNGESNCKNLPYDNDSSQIANTAFVHDNIDRCVLLSGSTMSGKLTLSGDPEVDMHAATKKYVDDNVEQVTVDVNKQPRGQTIADVSIKRKSGTVVNSIKIPELKAGANITLTPNPSDGTIQISCNPNISVPGGTMKVPVGTIVPYAGSSVPQGFLLCNGGSLNKSSYPELFGVIGYVFGGSGNTFKLPKLDDNRFIEGANSCGGMSEPGLPNITGSINSDGLFGFRYPNALNGSGAFEPDSSRKSQVGQGYTTGGETNFGVTFSARKSNSIYGNSTTVQPRSLKLRYIIKYTKSVEDKNVLSVNGILPDNMGNVAFDNLRLKYTYTPLINWNYVDEEGNRDGKTVGPNGAVFDWKGTSSRYNYKAVYSDGRYARYVIPLNDDFRNYDKLLIVLANTSEEDSPDIPILIFDSDIFDFMLNFPINASISKFYTIISPGSTSFSDGMWIPYTGSQYYAEYKTSWFAKSTPTRLVTYKNGSYSRPISEIYGLKRKWDINSL